VFVGTLTLDLLLGDVHSLKEKRSVIRPVIAELRRAFEVSVAETGQLDLHRRGEVSVGLVAADAAHIRDVLAACEERVANRPELELLAARTRVWSGDDDVPALPGTP
jgi:hypothetical protein